MDLNNKIEFILPTFNRPNNLLSSIYSLKAQTSDKWSAHIIIDGNKNIELYNPIIEMFKNNNQIKFSILDKNYNDWGHTPRNYGMENSKEEWVIMTGDDNYYVPTFVETFLDNIDDNINIVYCDMIHNHKKYEYYFNSELCINKIDIGNFMVRSKYGKTIKLKIKEFAADGIYVEEYVKKYCNNENNIKHIKQALYVHN